MQLGPMYPALPEKSTGRLRKSQSRIRVARFAPSLLSAKHKADLGTGRTHVPGQEANERGAVESSGPLTRQVDDRRTAHR